MAPKITAGGAAAAAMSALAQPHRRHRRCSVLSGLGLLALLSVDLSSARAIDSKRTQANTGAARAPSAQIASRSN
eukprot:2753159-Pleurochrysis_carterae.AAC.1